MPEVFFCFHKFFSVCLIERNVETFPCVVAEEDGYIVFPNPAAMAGQEWFYLAKSSPRAWHPDAG